MNLHPAIEAFFAADARRACEDLLVAFAPDAVVRDEGRSHLGREAIGEWWSQTKHRYETALEPLQARDGHGLTALRVWVTGQLPGSPATLTFAFRLTAGQITSLEIGA